MPSDSPVALCERHLAAASDWSAAEYGAVDLLPEPCRLCGSRLGIRLPAGWLCGVCEWRVGEIVDGELPPPRVEVVYYLRYENRVKIGTSSRPRRRLAAIWHQDLLAFERGDRGLEHRRHAQLAAERFARTEWFHLSDRLAHHVAVVGSGIDDPWDLYARWVSEALALRG